MDGIHRIIMNTVLADGVKNTYGTDRYISFVRISGYWALSGYEKAGPCLGAYYSKMTQSELRAAIMRLAREHIGNDPSDGYLTFYVPVFNMSCNAFTARYISWRPYA